MSLKRKRLSLKDKIDVIAESEKYALGSRKLAEKFGAGKSQINDIIRNKTELKRMFEEGVNLEQKRKFPKSGGLAVDQVVYNWFCKARGKNVPISGPLIKQKALEAASNLKVENFVASNGWLDCFCRRHNITFKSICGEAANINLEDVEAWKSKLLLILKDYSPRDVYNADETGLYYRAMPNKTFSLKNDKCTGRKAAKQRLTILLCANMEGEKEDPLIIGKSKNPRCFKGSHINKLPLAWVSNKKAWMTSEIMTKWLHKFDMKMKNQNRRVLLFLDNATSHSKILLDNVKLVFLPPNTTSHCQPLDQGIIQNFKILYRQYLIKRLLTFIDSGCDFEASEKSLNLTSALIWITSAWKKVSPLTIKKCFSKAGFYEIVQEEASFCEEDEIPLAQLFPSINNKIVSLKEFALIDSDAPTESPNFSISEIVEELAHNDEEKNSDINSDAEECENPKTTLTNMSEVCAKLRDVQNYLLCYHNGELAIDVSQTLLKCEAEVFKAKLKNLKQTKIEIYFKTS